MKIRKGKICVAASSDGKLSTIKPTASSSEIENTKDALNTADATQKKTKTSESTQEKVLVEANVAMDAAKTNSSTPRRKKDPLANLYSSLSPKYIGFSTPKSTTPAENLTPASEERGRSSRRRKLNASIESLGKNSLTSDLFMNGIEAVGYVRRTNSTNVTSSPISSSESEATAHRRSFESPIEKLLRKNRSNDSSKTPPSPAVVFEQLLPKSAKKMERKELMNIKVKVARVETLELLHKNGINTVQLDQHGKVIKVKGIITQDDQSPTVEPQEGFKSQTVEPQEVIKSQTVEPQEDVKSQPVEPQEDVKSQTIEPQEDVKSQTVKPHEDVEEFKSQTAESQEEVTSLAVLSGDDLNSQSVESEHEDAESPESTKDHSHSNEDLTDHVQNIDEESQGDVNNDISAFEDNHPLVQSNSKSETDKCQSSDEINGENSFNQIKIVPETNVENVNEEYVEDIECEAQKCIEIACEKENIDDVIELNSTIDSLECAEAEEDFNDEAAVIYQLPENDKILADANACVAEVQDLIMEVFVCEDSDSVPEEDQHVKVLDVIMPISVDITDETTFVYSEDDIKSDDKSSSEKKENAVIDTGDLQKVDDEVDKDSENTETKTEQNSKNEINLEQTSAPTEHIVSMNSPSSLSMDSAKGSSVINDVSWVSFSVGDLFWGQIYSYCYWPCMVCPDPDGKTITTEAGIGRVTVSHVMVHVRFFADNARRNWVKRDNLLPFNSLEHYNKKMEESLEKHGKKSAKYKAFVVSKARQKLWNQAIEEANILKSTPAEQRMEKFNEVYEHSKVFHKLDRKQRQSLYLTLGSTSDIGSLYDSSDNLSQNNISTGAKRERSISPFSPAYSPIGSKTTKRRKLGDFAEPTSVSLDTTSNQRHCSQDDVQAMGSSLSQSSATSTPSQQNEEIFHNSEFKTFFKMMKDFVMEDNNDAKLESSLVVAARNIWALKQINIRQMQTRASMHANELGSEVHSGGGSFKRLSSRLRNMTLKRNMLKPVIPQLSLPQLIQTFSLTVDEEKSKKPTNRPIEEVIDDIFNLDNKYLFKGLSRDPVCKYCFKPGDALEKCSNNCQSWFHFDCIGKSIRDKNKKKSRKSKTASCLDDSVAEKNVSLHITADDSEQLAEGDAPFSANSTDNPNDAALMPTSASTDVKDISKDTLCLECRTGEEPKCAVCNRNDSELEELVQCNLPHCQNRFHPACCKYWPQAKITKSKNKIESFRCPSHVCHTCVSDDPKGKFQNISSSKLTKCVKCPASFHTDSTCIPAGSQVLTAAHIICPRHNILKSDQKVNVNWCFICVGGGQVVCCETCPTAVHALCLNIPINSDEGYICEECETGRMPLYGEMVWAKFNIFRWWPAIILPPTEIPHNILRMPHSSSDFVVRFFGTHDHGWISRRRVYLYLEGDSMEPPKYKSSLDANYTRGVEEAKRIWEIIKSKKHVQRLTDESKLKLHPQPYVKIKSNRAVPPLKLHIDLEKVSKCECDKSSIEPCGPDSNCLNRVLYHECNPKLCPAGDRCQNQMFESRISPKLEVVYMKERGFGLVCREPISAGTFVIEYVGEVINDDEFNQRMTQKSIDRDENYYFLSLEKDYIIDAGPKGNLARFMNHSCDPNCETQKWSVNGLNRVGLFAITNIPADTELTFNYHWDELLGSEKKTCFCGSAKCAGQIGEKFKETKTKDDAKTNTNKKNKRAKVAAKMKPLKRLLKPKKSKAASKKVLKLSPTLKSDKKKKSISPDNSQLMNDSISGSSMEETEVDVIAS